MKKSYNDETKQTALLIDGQWQVASKVAENDEGRKAYLIGNKWIEDDEIENTRAKKGSVSYAAQGAGALPEAMARMGAGFVGQIGGGLASIPEQAYDLTLGGGMEEAAKTARKYSGWLGEKIDKVPRAFTPTKDFEDALGHGFEQAKAWVGEGAEAASKLQIHDPIQRARDLFSKDPDNKLRSMKRDQAARTAGEVLFDVELGRQGAAAAGRSIKGFKDRKEAKVAEEAKTLAEEAKAAEAAKQAEVTKWEFTNPETSAMDAQIAANKAMPAQQAPQYGIGEVPSNIPRDMFGQAEIPAPSPRDFSIPGNIPDMAGRRPQGPGPIDFARGEEGLAPSSGRPTSGRPIPFTREALPDQRTPEAMAAEAAMDSQTPRFMPDGRGRTLESVGRAETPPQLGKMNQAGELLPEDPTRPFYGDPRAGLTRTLPDTNWDLSRQQHVTEANLSPRELKTGRVEYDPANPTMGLEATTTRGAAPNPAGGMPGIPFEGNPTASGARANSRAMEAIARDSILKGMNTKLSNMTAQLDRVRQEQGRLMEEYGARRVAGQVGGTRAKELVAYTKLIKALEKDIAKQRERVDNRTQNHQLREWKKDLIEKTHGSDKPYRKAGFKRGQGGVIDQRILQALATLGVSELVRGAAKSGPLFRRFKDLPKGYSLEANVEKVFDPVKGLEDSLPALVIKLKDGSGSVMGVAEFVKDQSRDNLYSKMTFVGSDVGHQSKVVGKNYSKEMYKFAAELGNTIEASVEQTTAGQRMWEKFQDSGLAKMGDEGFPIIDPINTSAAMTGPKVRLPKSQRGGIDLKEISEGLAKLMPKKKPNVPLVQSRNTNEMLEMASGETRTVEQVKRDLGELKDLPASPFEKTLENISNGQAVINNSRNPFAKYVVDRVTDIRAKSTVLADSITQGLQVGKGMLLPKKIVDPKSPKALWDGLTARERKIETDIINEYNGKEFPTHDFMRAKGATNKIINSVETHWKGLFELHTRMNESLTAMGKSPLPFRPFYFMKAAGTGNWITRVKVPSKELGGGMETLAFHRNEWKWQANKFGNELQQRLAKEHPDAVVETVLADAGTRGNKYNVSTSLLEDIMGALEKSDPRVQAINSAIVDIKSKQGFRVHGAFRKGVGGMDLTPKNFWKTYEAYVQDASKFLSNLELQKLHKEIEVDKTIPPRLRKWSMDHIDFARGNVNVGTLLKQIEGGLDGFLQIASAGQFAGPGSARSLNRVASKLFMTSALMFGHAPFLLGTAAQAVAMAPAILTRYKNQLGKGNVIESIIKGGAEVAHQTPEYRGIIEYLTARGKIDPSLVHEVGLFSTDSLKFSAKIGDFLTGTFAARKLEGLSRMHSAGMSYHFFKGMGLKGKELHMAVERAVDEMMADYSPTESMKITETAGVLGAAAKPLSTFKNFYLTTSLIFMKEALQGVKTGNFKAAIPIANLWLSSALFGGILGSLAWKEVNFIWDFVKSLGFMQPALKAAFGFDINEKSPSLNEIVLRSNLPDAAKLGAFTGATKLIDPRGMHVSGSMAAPEFAPNIATWGVAGMFPGAAYAVDGMIAIGKFAGHATGLSPMTKQEQRATAKLIAPTTIDKIIDNWNTDTNEFGYGDRPVPGGSRGQGTYRRDGFETAAGIIGSGTIKEVKEKAAIRDIKEQQPDISARRSKLVDLAVDALEDNNDKQFSKAVEQAMQMGFTDFASAVNRAYVGRHRTEGERMGGRLSSPAQIEKWEFIQDAKK